MNGFVFYDSTVRLQSHLLAITGLADEWESWRLAAPIQSLATGDTEVQLAQNTQPQLEQNSCTLIAPVPTVRIPVRSVSPSGASLSWPS
jgi:hypothetical protein